MVIRENTPVLVSEMSDIEETRNENTSATSPTTRPSAG